MRIGPKPAAPSGGQFRNHSRPRRANGIMGERCAIRDGERPRQSRRAAMDGRGRKPRPSGNSPSEQAGPEQKLDQWRRVGRTGPGLQNQSARTA